MLQVSALGSASDCYFTTFVLCYLELGSNVRKQRPPFHTHDWFPSLWSRTGHSRVNPLIKMWGFSTVSKTRNAINKSILFMIQQSSKREAQYIRQARCGSAWATLTSIHLITSPMGPPGYPSMSGHILPPNFRWSRYLHSFPLGAFDVMSILRQLMPLIQPKHTWIWFARSWNSDRTRVHTVRLMGWAWQESTLQSFKLPRPVLCIGGILQVELLGREHRQHSDNKYYIWYEKYINPLCSIRSNMGKWTKMQVILAHLRQYDETPNKLYLY